MGLDSLGSLVIATFDLSVVRSVRDAIRTADLSSGKVEGASLLGPAPDACRGGRDGLAAVDRFEPTPVIDPRRVYHPEPRFEPRPVIHPEPRIASSCDVASTCDCTAEPNAVLNPSPIQPPWRVLLWDLPLALPEKKVIKVIVHPPDTARRGRMIDLFV